MSISSNFLFIICLMCYHVYYSRRLLALFVICYNSWKNILWVINWCCSAPNIFFVNGVIEYISDTIYYCMTQRRSRDWGHSGGVTGGDVTGSRGKASDCACGDKATSPCCPVTETSWWHHDYAHQHRGTAWNSRHCCKYCKNRGCLGIFTVHYLLLFLSYILNEEGFRGIIAILFSFLFYLLFQTLTFCPLCQLCESVSLLVYCLTTNLISSTWFTTLIVLIIIDYPLYSLCSLA